MLIRPGKSRRFRLTILTNCPTGSGFPTARALRFPMRTACPRAVFRTVQGLPESLMAELAGRASPFRKRSGLPRRSERVTAPARCDLDRTAPERTAWAWPRQ